MTDLIRRLSFLDAWLAHASRRRAAARSAIRSAVCTRSLEVEGGPALEERRGDAMRRLFPKLHPWRATTFDRSSAVQAYTYLAAADTVDDLERRIHQIELRRHFRH